MGRRIIGVTLTDTAGNSSHTDVTLNVALNKTLGAGVNALFGGDGVLNLAESLLTQVISGNATGDYNGAVVHVTVAGITLDANVGGNGQWSVSLLPSQLSLLGDGLAQIQVQIVDSHGNVVNDLIDIDVLTQNLPVIGPVTAFGDGLLNAVEAGVSQTISGVINGLGIGGGSVSVSLGTKTYTASVGAGGAWSLSIPPLDLAALSDGNLALGVSVTDSAGNVVSKNIDITAIIHNLPHIVLDPNLWRRHPQRSGFAAQPDHQRHRHQSGEGCHHQSGYCRFANADGHRRRWWQVERHRHAGYSRYPARAGQR